MGTQFCIQFVLAPDWPAMYVVCMPSVWHCNCALHCHPNSHVVLPVWCYLKIRMHSIFVIKSKIPGGSDLFTLPG